VVFAIFYGLAPGAFHIANAVGYDYTWAPYTRYTHQLYPLSLVLIVVSYLFLRAGWLVAGTFYDSGTALYDNTAGDTDDAKLMTKIVITAWLLLVASIAVYYLYSLAYGGFVGLAAVSNALRAGWAEISNPWSFLKRFGGLTIVASYLFLVAIRANHVGGHRYTSRLGFILSFIFSLYVLLTWQGRLTLAFYILSLILADSAFRQRRIRTSTLFVLGALISSMLFAGDSLLYIFRQAIGESGRSSIFAEKPGLESVQDFVLGELSFPIVSINTALTSIYNGVTDMRFFVDIYLGLLGLIPQRWLTNTIETASTINGRLIDSSLAGTIPTDLISFGVYSLGAYGPPVVSFILGLSARITQRYITEIRPSGLGVVLFFAYGLTIARSIAYADPTQILEGSFYLLLGTAITLLVLKVRFGGAHES